MVRNESICMPISHQQEYIMYGENYGKRSAKSILVEGRLLKGTLDMTRMHESILKVVEQNEALRMICVKQSDTYYLKLKSVSDTDIFFSDRFSDIDSVKKDTVEHLEHSMELSKGLFQVRIYSLDAQNHALIIVMHHLISDSTALSVVLSEILLTYAGNAPDKTETVGFCQFLEEEQSFFESTKGQEQLQYWTKEMEGYIPPKSDGGGSWFDVIKDSTFYISNDKLQVCAEKHRVSRFILLLSAIHLAVGEMFNTNDTTIGVAFANRIQKKYHNTVGYLAHMVQNRIICDVREKSNTFLQQVAKKFSENIKYQRLSHYAAPAKINIGVQDDPLSKANDIFEHNETEKIYFDIERSIDYILISIKTDGARTKINLFCDPYVYSKDFIIKMKNIILNSVNNIINIKEDLE